MRLSNSRRSTRNLSTTRKAPGVEPNSRSNTLAPIAQSCRLRTTPEPSCDSSRADGLKLERVIFANGTPKRRGQGGCELWEVAVNQLEFANCARFLSGGNSADFSNTNWFAGQRIATQAASESLVTSQV